MSINSINCHSRKVRYKIDCYILHTGLLAIILLLIIAIICYRYAKHWSKQKKYLCTLNIKIENNKFKTVCVKNRTCYYFDDIIKFEDFDYNNILIDENILIYNIPYKNLIGPKSLRIRFGKVD